MTARPTAPIGPADAALLLPRMPSDLTVRADARTAGEITGWWGRSDREDGTLAVAAGPRDGVRDGADDVLVLGRGARRSLRRDGYGTVAYRLRPVAGGATALVPAGGPVPRPARARWRPRGLIAAGVRRVRGTHAVTVAARVPGPPAVLRAALGPQPPPATLLVGGGGPRRRAVFLVGAAPGPCRVVKVGRERDGAARAPHEQEVLRRLHEAGLGDRVPRPLGHGASGPLVWSVETALSGRPLAGSGARLAMLEAVCRWLARVGTATADPQPWDPARDVGGLRLRGRHRDRAARASRLAGVPAVLTHGDLGSGVNVLVAGPSFGVIDWETAVRRGLPLVDVLPLLCGALTTDRADPAARARRILELCRGRDPASPWLFDRLHGYCRTVGVPLHECGRIAALVWAYQASMRLVHDELVELAGGRPAPWVSAWDGVADGWWATSGLGPTWSALLDHRPGAVG